MHQHRFRDALQTSRGCWALREPTRKERAGEQAGRGRARVRSPARALPAAPARAWARPGRRRARKKLLLPSPSSFPPALLEGLCGRDSEAPGFSNAGWGRAGQPQPLKGKPKVCLRASLIRGSSREGLGRPGFASLCPPPPKDLSRRSGVRVARGGRRSE